MKENYAIYKVWDGGRAPSNLEFNGRLRGQLVRTVSVDVDALLELADKMQCQQYMREDARLLRWDEAARRIRKALGAVE